MGNQVFIHPKSPLSQKSTIEIKELDANGKSIRKVYSIVLMTEKEILLIHKACIFCINYYNKKDKNDDSNNNFEIKNLNRSISVVVLNDDYYQKSSKKESKTKDSDIKNVRKEETDDIIMSGIKKREELKKKEKSHLKS